jgi:hypothetical protein
MSKEVWEKAKAIIGTHHKLELGPYYASQALYAPRHLLFKIQVCHQNAACGGRRYMETSTLLSALT